MYAYELLPKLTFLTLVSKDEGGFEWIGTDKDWQNAREMEKMMSNPNRAKILWN